MLAGLLYYFFFLEDPPPARETRTPDKLEALGVRRGDLALRDHGRMDRPPVQDLAALHSLLEEFEQLRGDLLQEKVLRNDRLTRLLLLPRPPGPLLSTTNPVIDVVSGKPVLVDRYGKVYRFSRKDLGTLLITSAGRDRTFATEDDLFFPSDPVEVEAGLSWLDPTR